MDLDHNTNEQPFIMKPTKTLAQIILDRITCKNDDFMALIQQHPHAYAERLYLGFVASVTVDKPQGDDSQICTEITKIGELIDTVKKYEARILNLAGVGPELAEVHEYQDCMEEVQWWLEDILCGIMEEVEVLFCSHESHQLLYQQVMKQVNGNVFHTWKHSVVVIFTGSKDHLDIIPSQHTGIMGAHRGKRGVALEDSARYSKNQGSDLIPTLTD
ncbi:hypothetical protein IW261DRAFT_1424181 [Armillaria novae-zelandiae]|uniref:Uncharacterized protein n=1 Tax=Armillaria novae-zelandiae TaxID=153914 RepID=A0AA39NVD6_9AGAR|nr:hypothetical protein IW261DRAFT_1424181 [Armillaria novae-zelandiae]